MKKYILSWHDANGFQHDGNRYETIEDINEKAANDKKVYGVLEKTGKYNRKYIGWTNGEFHPEEKKNTEEEMRDTLSHLNLYEGIEYLKEINFIPIFLTKYCGREGIDLNIAVSPDFETIVVYHFENADQIDFNTLVPPKEVNELIGEISDNYWRLEKRESKNGQMSIRRYSREFSWDKVKFELSKAQAFGWIEARYVYKRAMQILFNNVSGRNLQEGEKIINELLQKDVYLKKIQPYMSFKMTPYANEEFHPGIVMDVNCYVLDVETKHYEDCKRRNNALTFVGETRGSKEHNIVVNGEWKYNNPPLGL